MRGAIARVTRYIEGLDRDQFIADEKSADAVARNLEVIGEAAARLPQDVREHAPDVSWERIIHEYFGLDLEIVRAIITRDPPILQTQLTELRRGQEG